MSTRARKSRPRGAADVKKTARHFLSCPDLGERPVLFYVQIDLERLLIRTDVHFRVHADTVEAAVLSGNGREGITAARLRRFSTGSSRADCSAAPRRSNHRAGS
jgi:hypothetical protein